MDHVEANHLQSALSGSNNVEIDANERRLTRTVGAEDAEDLAPRNGQRDVVNRDDRLRARVSTPGLHRGASWAKIIETVAQRERSGLEGHRRAIGRWERSGRRRPRVHEW